MSDFLSALRLQVAANCQMAAALVGLVSGVQHDGKESSERAPDGASVVRVLVRDSNNGSAGDTGSGAPMKERHGITRQAHSPNVLEVDFAHFRFVRDVRRALYNDRRSPLAPRHEVT
jgi:hypothetical protein